MEDLVLAMNPENPGWDFRSLNSVREQPVFVLFETFFGSELLKREVREKVKQLFYSRNKTNL